MSEENLGLEFGLSYLRDEIEDNLEEYFKGKNGMEMKEARTNLSALERVQDQIFDDITEVVDDSGFFYQEERREVVTGCMKAASDINQEDKNRYGKAMKAMTETVPSLKGVNGSNKNRFDLCSIADTDNKTDLIDAWRDVESAYEEIDIDRYL